jgi:hypothetical protein
MQTQAATKSVEQIDKQIESALAAHEQARAALAKAEEQVNLAVISGSSSAAEARARKVRDEARGEETACRERLDTLREARAQAVKAEAGSADEERFAKMAAAKVRMHRLMHDAEAPIAALAEIVRKVQEAQQECLALAKREEREVLHWELDPINGRLPRVVIDRLLPHCESFKPLSEYGLGWQDKAAGRITWADGLKKREAKADAEVAA